MAHYTALINAWNNPTVLPAGVTGTLLSGLSTANKIVAINGWTITGSVPALAYATGAQIFNCIAWSEFEAITAAQQTLLLQVCSLQGQILGGSSSLFIAPFFGTLASKMPSTIAALLALAQAIAQPWWEVPQASGGGGLTSTVSNNDLAAAGGLT